MKTYLLFACKKAIDEWEESGMDIDVFFHKSGWLYECMAIDDCDDYAGREWIGALQKVERFGKYLVIGKEKYEAMS